MILEEFLAIETTTTRTKFIDDQNYRNEVHCYGKIVYACLVLKIVNIQNRKGKAQPYQIRQFLAIVEENSLKLEEDS